jgi:hypothetical protein
MDEIPPFLTVSEINSKEKGNPPPQKKTTTPNRIPKFELLASK